jgi:hypothetical protein
MVGELDVQKECQKRMCTVVNLLRQEITDRANEIKNRDTKVTPRNLVLFTAVAKIVDTARVILFIRNIRATDEMNMMLRPMVEMAVNACYLHEGPDEEIQRFIYFDSINNHTAMLDLEKVSGNRVRVPKATRDSVIKRATEAATLTGLKLGSREWTKVTLFNRAALIDKAVGGFDFAALMANMYVSGSGYVHGTYKTMDRYRKWMLDSEEEHPLSVMYGATNAISGIGHVLITLGRYFHSKFGTCRDKIDEWENELIRVSGIALEDFKLHRKKVTAKK